MTKGSTHSQETLKKMSLAKSGKPLTKTHRLNISLGRKAGFKDGTIKNWHKEHRGERSPFFKGGRRKSLGYILIYKDGKWIREHRWIMEQHLGRKLLCTEVVHHINGNKADNRLINLQVLNKEDHTRQYLIQCPNCKFTFKNL